MCALAAYTLLSVAAGVDKNKHKKNSFDARYVRLCLSDFAHVRVTLELLDLIIDLPRSHDEPGVRLTAGRTPGPNRCRPTRHTQRRYFQNLHIPVEVAEIVFAMSLLQWLQGSACDCS